jgi:drug/metabolite transporter (DMT)-like permease
LTAQRTSGTSQGLMPAAVPHPQSRSLPFLSLLFTVFVWGIGPVFIRTLSIDLGPADHLVIRYAIVAVAYLAGLVLTGGWRIARADWPRLLLIGLVGMIGYNIGSAFGFEKVSASLGSLVIGTQPLLIAVLAASIAGERLTIPALAGLVVALAGIIVLFVPDMMSARIDAQSLAGAGLVFSSGVAWAIYVVMSVPLIRKYGPYPITAWSIAIAAVPMVMGLALISGRTLETAEAMTAVNWRDMAFMAGISTFAATITWNYGAARLNAAAAGATLYLVPVIGVVSGALMLGESITAPMIAGGLLILAGVAVTQFGPGLLRRR